MPMQPKTPRLSSYLLHLLLLCALAISGCHKDPTDPQADAEATESETPSDKKTSADRTYHKGPFENYVEKGDLAALEKRGSIRFVNLVTGLDTMLPRATIVTQLYFDLSGDLAKRLGLEPYWVTATTPEEALQMLEDGRADVVAANLTRTEERAERYDLSENIYRVREQLIAGKNGPDISSVDKLKDVTIIALADSTYMETAKKLVEKIPNAKLEPLVLNVGEPLDRVFDKMKSRKDAVMILDSNIVEGFLSYRDDLKAGAMVSEEEDIVWAMRKGSSELRLRINNFLTKKLIKAPVERTADWDAIKKSDIIRFLTYNGPTSYFMWKGELMGFDYDLAKAFAKKHDIELQLIAVPPEESLIEWLKKGRGDFAGASMTITPERKAQGVAFTTPYFETAQQILSNKSKPEIKTLDDLNGRTVTLRPTTAFVETAKALQKKGIKLKIEFTPPEVSYEAIMNMVASGEADMTIVDAHAAKVQSLLRDTLLAGPLVSDPLPQGWMVEEKNQALLKKLDAFLSEYVKSERYAKKVKTYFEPDRTATAKLLESVTPDGDLSPYDKLVKRSARKHEFDWRLIVAQMWQESSFNPKAESPVGAQGLLQVMPRTAEEVGYPPPLFDPKRGIEAGVKYLNWVRDRFDEDLTLENKLWFSLASYNAGIGHLYDAQRLAEELGLDPNVWFDNVEKAMLKLSEPRYFKKARYGYVRGAEPVHYVQNISNIYKAYTDLKPGDVGQIHPWELPTVANLSARLELLLNQLKVSVSSPAPTCQYSHQIPFSGGHRQPIAADMWPSRVDESCLQQSSAIPAVPDPGQSSPSPRAAGGAGSTRSGSDVSASPVAY